MEFSPTGRRPENFGILTKKLVQKPCFCNRNRRSVVQKSQKNSACGGLELKTLILATASGRQGLLAKTPAWLRNDQTNQFFALQRCFRILNNISKLDGDYLSVTRENRIERTGSGSQIRDLKSRHWYSFPGKRSTSRLDITDKRTTSEQSQRC